MTNNTALRIAAWTGFLGVALGAFGAHGLKEIFTRHNTAPLWERAVLYHLIHAIMLFVLASRRPFSSGPWWSFFIGIILFSGSLYLLVLTNTRWLGAITPFGGIGFLLGWLWLIATADRREPSP